MSIKAQIKPSAKIVSKQIISSSLSKEDVSLGNVNNTSDANKPISTLTQAALNLKADTSNVYVKSEVYTQTQVNTKIADVVGGAPGTLDTLKELSDALGSNTNFATTTASALGERLVKGNNLSDLADAAVARTNLGLGNVNNKSSETIISEIVDADIPSTIARDSELLAHTSLTDNPHNVTAGDLGLTSFVNLSPDDLPISSLASQALDTKANSDTTYTKTEVDDNISSGISDKITLDNLSVGPNEQPNGNGGLSYDALNGQFTYTPPALDTEFFRESISVGATAAPNGGGGLTYNNFNGEFTYTPPGVSDLTSISVTSQATPLGNGGIAFNNSNGELTYTPPVINSLTNLGDVDFGSNKILYSNHYATANDLPSASTYHGMFAHVHSTGRGYFAHAGNWVELANFSDIPSGLNGLGEVINEDRFIVSTGTGAFEYQSGTTVRDSLGLGVDDTPEFNGIDLDGGDLVLDIVGNTKITTSGPPNQIDFEFDDGTNTNTSESKLQIKYDVVNGNGALVPTTDDDIDLGSSVNKFKDLYVKSIESDSIIVTGSTLGFYGTAGQSQPTTSISSATGVATTVGFSVLEGSTFDGYTIGQVVKALRDLGLLA